MFLFLIFHGILAYFIPFNVSNSFTIDTADKSILFQMMAEYHLLIGLACSSDDVMLLSAFTNAMPLFPEAKFVAVFPAAINEIMNSTVPKDPFLILCKDGKIFNTIGPIDDSNTLLYMIDLYATNSTKSIISSKSEIVSGLGGAPTTVISEQSQYQNVLSMVKDNILELGPTDVISINDVLAKELFDEDSCGVFTKSDGNLRSFDCKTVDVLKNYSIPSFKKATVDTLIQSTKICVLFHDSEFYNNQTEFLYKVGSHYTDIDFFVIESNSKAAEFVKDFLGYDFVNKERPTIAFVDFNNSYIYDLQFFDELENDTYFNTRKWTASTVQMILQIMSGQAKKHLRSEPIPLQKDSILHKVVGLTHTDFVNEPGKDVLMLYVRPDSIPCQNAFSDIKTLAKDSAENDNKNLKFGFMDSTKNKVEGGIFPFPYEPAFVFYPANNKTVPRILLGISLPEIRYIIKSFAYTPVKFSQDEKLDNMNYLLHQSEYAKIVKDGNNLSKEQLNTIDETLQVFVNEVIHNINTNPSSKDNSFSTITNEL